MVHRKFVWETETHRITVLAATLSCPVCLALSVLPCPSCPVCLAHDLPRSVLRWTGFVSDRKFARGVLIRMANVKMRSAWMRWWLVHSSKVSQIYGQIEYRSAKIRTQNLWTCCLPLDLTFELNYT